MSKHDTRLHGARLASHLQTQLDQMTTVTEQVTLLDRLATAVEHEMHAQLGWLRRERDRRASELPQNVHFGTDDDADDAKATASVRCDDGGVRLRMVGPDQAEKATSGQQIKPDEVSG